MGFFFIFILSFIVITLLLSTTELDFVTSLSAAATSLANVGPGLGNTIGPENNFFNVPVLAKFYLTDGLSLEGGPQFGFLVNDEFEIEDSNGNSIEVEDLDAASFDLGAALGLGYKFTNGLFLQGRYVLGLSNVDDSEEEGAFEDDLTNSTLQFSVGLQF